MTGQALINKFELYVDDGTELSATDELSILNKIYSEVLSLHPWEFLKKEFSGVINGTSVALPTDFGSFTETEISDEMKKVVFIDDKQYEVIPYSQRKNYSGPQYCYPDMVNKLLVFNESVSGTIKYDYIYIPAALTLSTEPVFPERFQHCLYHLVAADDYMIQQFDKAKSYASENRARANDFIEAMEVWNANLAIN